MRKRETSPCFFYLFFLCVTKICLLSLWMLLFVRCLCCERKQWHSSLGTWSREECEGRFFWGGGVVEVNVLAVCLWYCLCSSVQHVYIRHSCTTTRLRAEKLTSTCVSLDLHASVFMCVWDGSLCMCLCVCVCVSSWGPDWCVGAMLGDECASSQFISQSVGPLGDRRACSYSLASRKSVSCGNNLASNRVDPGSSWVIWEETRWCFGGGGNTTLDWAKDCCKYRN